MQKIYINTVTREFFNSDGDAFPDGFPKLAYKRQENIVFQLCTATPNAGEESIDFSTWTKDTSFGKEGVTALLSLDSDFRRRHSGSVTEVSAGKISAKFSGVNLYNIPSSGVLRLWKNGIAEGMRYTLVSATTTNGVFIFDLADGEVIPEWAAPGVELDIPDSLYAQAIMDAETSNPAEGLFSFNLYAFSEKLRARMEYANMSTLDDLAGMELLLFSTNGDSIDILNNFLCSTVSITGTMAEANPIPDLPSAEMDTFLALVSAEVQRQLGIIPATSIKVSPAAQYFASKNIESALQEIGSQLEGLGEMLTSAAETAEGI